MASHLLKKWKYTLKEICSPAFVKSNKTLLNSAFYATQLKELYCLKQPIGGASAGRVALVLPLPDQSSHRGRAWERGSGTISFMTPPSQGQPWT